MVEIDRAKIIMGRNYIGLDEIRLHNKLNLLLPDNVPSITFSEEELKMKKEDYLLILGIKRFADGSSVTIRGIKALVGQNPEVGEPCFYNQDWYDKERFIDVPMTEGWYLIRKNIFDDSRAVQPGELEEKYDFPTAISCVYAFFLTWYVLGIKLWYHDFVWCSDKDHNGDRIYVGKYHDIDGLNKNGFSIHRHLALRACYGCID